MKATQRIAVRDLVESILRAGDLELTFLGSTRPVEGIRAHQKIQRSRPAGYTPEVTVRHEIESEAVTLVIGGRIDGVLETADETIVEEIKSTTWDLEAVQARKNNLHWGQVKVYAYLYAISHDLTRVTTRLTYYQLDSHDTLEKQRQYTTAALKDFFDDLVKRYLRWAETVGTWLTVRDAAIRELAFPFVRYRPGQREMAVAVYRTIRDNGQLMVEAATGIGKTMAALFPAVKAVADDLITKIFFLTARTTGKHAAQQALTEMRSTGLKLKSLTLTAKDKICFCPEATCTPAECTYAKGYYDRINTAVEAAFALDAFTRETVERIAAEHRVCPFEFSLELALWSDCIICDYNYAFDPRVYLRRFFEEAPQDCTLLVDEAHNLPDRSREMFSARITKQPFLDVRRELKKDLPGLYRTMGRISRWMAGQRKRCQAAGEILIESTPPAELNPLLNIFLKSSERWLATNVKTSFRQSLLDLYFEVRNYLRVAEAYDPAYATIWTGDGKDLALQLYCLDPAGQMAAALERSRSCVLFSGTLAPADYYRHLCGYQPTAAYLTVASPFPRENLCVLVAANISTLYTQRSQTKKAVAGAISALVNQRRGNYLVFFPSYAYMTLIHEELNEWDSEVVVMVQTPDMSEADRDGFLERFAGNSSETRVGLVVMGGIFAEGIDLVGERLTGAAIVGVGLPGISPQRDLIRRHFDATHQRGFDYAYRYPGMVRVFQAAGRVIRSGHDRGVVLLIDQRFAQHGYRSLLPAHWRPSQIAAPDGINAPIQLFWDRDSWPDRDSKGFI